MCLWVQPIECARVRLHGNLGGQKARSRSRERGRRVCGGGSKCGNGEYRGHCGRVWKVRQDSRTEGTPSTICTPRVRYRREDQDCRGPDHGRRRSAPGSRTLTPATLQGKCGRVSAFESAYAGTWEVKEPVRASEKEDGGCVEEDRKCGNGEYRGRRGRVWKVRQDSRTDGTPSTICTPRVRYRREDQDCRGPAQG
ncbi:hypothetical protein NDU88_005135 [Pleurodeles waltl]|uniref:Uncharacterized protein n=1 Tax=Pleurodeles waltl TaxID=8319 RepID=A0AAV7WXE9_PLEWA|nr:hypothetical protein NDU88_005135 [Pleurodeles waltl]